MSLSSSVCVCSQFVMFEVFKSFEARCFKGVSKKFQGCFKEVLRVFQGSFKGGS